MSFTIDTIYNMDCREEDWCFIEMFNKLNSNHFVSFDYDCEPSYEDLNPRFQIFRHLIESDGYRGVWFHSLSFEGVKFALIGQAGRGGDDEEMIFITDKHTMKSCFRALQDLALKVNNIKETDPLDPVGHLTFYGKPLFTHFFERESEEFNKQAEEFVKRAELQYSRIADTYLVAPSEAQDSLDQADCVPHFLKRWLRHKTEEYDLKSPQGLQEFVDHAYSLRVELADIIGDAFVESAKSLKGVDLHKNNRGEAFVL